MGKLPAPVYSDGLKKRSQTKFYGYEALGTEGAIRDMKNMTSDYWPELAVRDRRQIMRQNATTHGMGAYNELMYFNVDFVYGLDSDPNGIELPGYDYDKYTFAALGDYITIWPNKAWYKPSVRYKDGNDWAETTLEYGLLEESVTALQGVSVFLSETSPEGLSDTSNCLDLGASGEIRPGDAVTISGCVDYPANNQTLIVREISGTKLYFYDYAFTMPMEWRCYITTFSGMIFSGSYTIETIEENSGGGGHWNPTTYLNITLSNDLNADYLVWDKSSDVVRVYWHNSLQGTFNVSEAWQAASNTLSFAEVPVKYTESGTITVARTVPDMDFVFAHENRLFGYKGDVIYASKLGDPFNWNVYDGLATDSWTTETGTPGSFTGGISFGGYARFFKEDQIFTLYGDYPAEFTLQHLALTGVEAGSERSLTNVNGRLFYLSPQGPCVFTGGTPIMIGDAFGVTKYRNGVGGTDGVKYYLSMEDTDGNWHLFAYDTRRGIWIREDDMHAVAMCQYKNLVWCLSYSGFASGGRICVLGRAEELLDASQFSRRDFYLEDEVEWFVEFGDILDESPDRKRLAKLQVRLEMEEGSYAEVLLKYDSAPSWDRVQGMTVERKQTVVLPIVPRRLDHFRLKIQGKGACRISSITRQAAAGSDRR